MKIVSLNLQHGGRRRIPALSDYLLGTEADILVLPEYRPIRSDPLRQALYIGGYTHFGAAGVDPSQNTVAIAAKKPFVPRTYPELSVSDRRRLISAHFDNFTVYGTYFDGKKAKGPLFEFLLSEGHQPTEPAYCIVGDFNTGCSDRDQSGKGKFFHADKFLALPDIGLIDSWRSRNPDERVYSWYSNIGNGFRIDHVFSSTAADAVLKSVAYDHAVREVRTTDHSAMLVEYDLEALAAD